MISGVAAVHFFLAICSLVSICNDCGIEAKQAKPKLNDQSSYGLALFKIREKNILFQTPRNTSRPSEAGQVVCAAQSPVSVASSLRLAPGSPKGGKANWGAGLGPASPVVQVLAQRGSVSVSQVKRVTEAAQIWTGRCGCVYTPPALGMALQRA